MARIRTIKPDFWTDEKLTECSMSARLFFIGLWNFADDNGNLTRSAKKLKMQIFPADPIDCEPLVQELMLIGVLIEYEADDEKFLHIKGFKKHQVINRPSKTSIPEPKISEDVTQKTDDSVSTHGVITDGREGNGKEKDISLPAASPKKTKKIPLPEGFEISDRVRQWATEKGYNRLEAHFENFVGSCRANGYTYADWDEGFMGAIRKDWAKLGTPSQSGAKVNKVGGVAYK